MDPQTSITGPSENNFVFHLDSVVLDVPRNKSNQKLPPLYIAQAKCVLNPIMMEYLSSFPIVSLVISF